MTYGPAIECNGKRPEWLGDDEQIYRFGGWWHAKGIAWGSLTTFRLPADHPYYRATAAGFKYWPGGDAAPDDWDGGEVLLKSGIRGRAGDCWDWRYVNNPSSPFDAIIGYHPKPEAAEGIISSDTIAGGPLESQGTSPEAPPAFRPKDLRDEYAMHIAAGLLAAGGMPIDRLTFARKLFEIADAFMLAREVGR